MIQRFFVFSLPKVGCIIYILAQSRVALKELLLKNHVASQLVV